MHSKTALNGGVCDKNNGVTVKKWPTHADLAKDNFPLSILFGEVAWTNVEFMEMSE